MSYGVCDPPRPPCRFRHVADDGVSPCCFGLTCRFGHKGRVSAKDLSYWIDKNSHRGGISPAVRNPNELQSQLEPFSTGQLRTRLAKAFGHDHRELDPMSRQEIMKLLLQGYATELGGKDRPTIHIQPHSQKIPEELQRKLLCELKAWKAIHTTNTRPSIDAQSYMILRDPDCESSPSGINNNSRQAQLARKKLLQYETLYKLALRALEETGDHEFIKSFSALAVTFMFQGSPHIDKQNTGPFYGLSLGDFTGGGICVEAEPFLVAEVETHNQLAKVDGRYPHWVAPYTGTRFSLIYYSTTSQYEPPGPAYFGKVIDQVIQDRPGLKGRAEDAL